MARPMRVASTSHRRAWVRSGGHVTDHVAVVVEAVEPVGQLPHPGGDLVGGTVDAGQGHDLGQLGQLAQDVELALVGEQREVGVRERRPDDARLGRLAPDGVDAGVGVLDVEDGVLVRLRGDEVEVDRLAGVERLEQEREPGHVRARRPRRGRRAAPSSPARLDSRTSSTAPHEEDQLPEDELELVRLVAEGLDAGLQPGDVAVVVGAPDVDQQLIAAGELVAVVGDVRQQVGGLAVGLDEHAVLVVTEVGGAQPHRTVLLEDHTLGPQVGQRGVDGTGVDEAPAR